MIRYVVQREPHGSDRQVLSRMKMRLRVARFTATGWTFRTKKRGEEWRDRSWMGRKAVRRRISRRTDWAAEGFKLFVQRKRDRKVLSVHKIEVEPPVQDLGCNPKLEQAHAALIRRFGAAGVPSGGRYYCRYVSGTNTVSYHGKRSTDPPAWRGGAEDTFSSPDNMSALVERARFLINETQAGRLDCSLVIVGQSYWEPGRGWNYYSGVYHRHVHHQYEGGVFCSP